MQTQPDQIIGELLCELMKFQVVKSDGTEKHEADYFRARLVERFARKDCALQHLADQNVAHVSGWCSFALACLNIEGENCRSRETLGHFYAVAIDAALSNTGAGSSCELDRVRDFKKRLFNELKSRGFRRTEIESASSAIRDQMYIRGSLMAAICADAHSRSKITRNIVKGIATNISARLTDAGGAANSDHSFRVAIVDRIAAGMASGNGDPILEDVRIISESVGPAFARPEEETPIAVDDNGSEYFTHVREDGRGQIEIQSPHGEVTTLKFWPPESYITPASLEGGETARQSSGNRATSESVSWRAVIRGERAGESGDTETFVSETVARKTQTAWYRFSSRMCLIAAHCSIPAGGITGSLLCVWILGADWNGWMTSPFMMGLVIVAAFSPAAFVAMHYGRRGIGAWCRKVPGGIWIHLILTLLILPGGIVSFVGACFLVIGGSVLSILAVTTVISLVKASIGL